MNVTVLWLMIKLKNFFYDTGKYLALSKGKHQKDNWEVHQMGKKIWDTRLLWWPKIAVLQILASASVACLSKCNLYNYDNVHRCRIKNAAEKWDLHVHVHDVFMASYTLGAGSGKEFDT